MKKLYTLMLVCLLALSTSASLAGAQTRGRRTTTPQRRRSSNSTPARRSAATSNEAVADGRSRVAEQIKLLSRFLYLFGRISSGVEAAEDQARRSNIEPQSVAAINRNTASLRQNLENVRDGLDQLELHFRTTPELERFYSRLNGVGAAAADAENRAASGQLDAAGRRLLEVVNQLADVLREMN
ncbi:MAG TPA: hypothetical protein VNA19_02950 [Pyrinomonadaceae bacterium]|nr:hypothetical protein [Pyrinomonadaceae bacterium]